MTETRTHPAVDWQDPRGQSEASRQALEVHRAAPETAAITHGAYLSQGAYMVCAKCCLREGCEHFRDGQRCRIEEEYAADRHTQIAEALQADGADLGLHSALISMAILAELRLARAMRYLAMAGELLPGMPDFAEYQPLAKEIPRLMGEIRSALTALNLTPAAMARLAVQKPQMPELARAILSLDAGEEGEGDVEPD